MARADGLFFKEKSRCLLSMEESGGLVLYGREQAARWSQWVSGRGALAASSSEASEAPEVVLGAHLAGT
jgi:hypothetical protein